jgi:ABC-2 type transport system permease protein
MSELALPALRPVAPVRDGLTMVTRCVRLSMRTTDALILALALPVMLMLLFVYLFGGAISTGGQYVNYVVPGVILLCVGFASGQTAVSVAQDMRAGVIDRFRSMNISGPAMLAGHVVASVLRNCVATAIVIGVAFAIGFRPHAGIVEWLATAGILLAFMLAISWLAATLGLLAGAPEAANGYSFFISFLPYPSSAFVPVDTMPSWLQGVARNQPITPVIESVRGLLLGGPVGAHAWQGLAWCAGIAAVSIAAAALLFRRRTA